MIDWHPLTIDEKAAGRICGCMRCKAERHDTLLKTLPEVLDFLNSIEGAGYGGMASFEIARAYIRDAVGNGKEPS